MKKWKVCCTGLVSLASLCPEVLAQVPVGQPAPVAVAPVAAAPAAQPATLWSFLGLTKDPKDAMKRKCCQTPLGQLFGSLLTPVRVMSGGVLGNFCPTTPTLADQAKPGAEGMAAKVQADEAAAKARRAAVRYLGTVDCHFWPEVQDALILSLRADRNECVRWEAAMALGGGCCCTKKTIQALLVAATGSNKDEYPTETCERVREAAMMSLQHCLECFSQEVPAEPKKPELPPGRTPEKPRAQAEGQVQLTAFYLNLDNKSLAETVQETRLALGQAPNLNNTSGATTLATGARSVFNIVANAMNTPRVRRAGNASVRVTGMENGTTQPEPIPMTTFSASPVPELQPVEIKPAAGPVKRVLIKSATPTVPELQPAVVQPQAAPEPAAAPALPRLLAPETRPAAAPQKVSRGPAGADPEPYLVVLKRSIYPFQREWAVNCLAGADWQGHPEVLQAVLSTAKQDSAPTVRAACIRTLVTKRMAAPEAITVVQDLRADPDPRVVNEATAALPQLASVQRANVVQPAVAVSVQSTTSADVQPASFTLPSRSIGHGMAR